ncbi:MAG: carotenoid biosynthesis protein [Janthinobacterium lividum]
MSKARISIFLVILFHLVGLIGFLIPFLRPLFLQIVPFHLLLMLFLVLINHQERNLKFASFIGIIMALGFAAEWIGVHKQWLFGHYAYGATLGFKVDEIPLMIGINWFLLIYATGVLTQKLPIKTAWTKILSGAVLLVLLDLLIEPVAIRFDYWHWFSTEIPLKNYVCWLLMSVFLLTIFQQFNFKNQNWVAPVLLLIQFVFFAVLNFA